MIIELDLLQFHKINQEFSKGISVLRNVEFVKTPEEKAKLKYLNKLHRFLTIVEEKSEAILNLFDMSEMTMKGDTVEEFQPLSKK